MNRFRMLSFQITAWMFLVAITPFVIGGVFIGFYLKDRTYQNHIASLKVVYKDILKSIDKNVGFHISILENTTRIPLIALELKKVTPRTKTIQIGSLIEAHIKNIVIRHDYYDFFIISKDGVVVYSYKKESDLGQNLSTGYLYDSPLAEAYNQAAYTLGTALVDVAYHPPSKLEAAFAVTPILADGKLLGYVGVQIAKERIFELAKGENGLGQTGEIVAGRAGLNGQVFAAMPLKYDKEAFKNKRVLNSDKFATGMRQAIDGMGASGEIIDYRGVECLAVWGFEPNMRWGIVVKTDKQEALSGVYDQLKIFSVAFVLAMIFVFLFAVTVSKNISRPILSLVFSMKRFKLDFHHRANVVSQNEIGYLATEFNSMADNIGSQVEMLHTQAALLEEQAAEIEEHSQLLEERVEERTAELVAEKVKSDRYVGIIDKFVITSSTDINGDITDVSDAFCKISGYSKEELLGKNHRILRDPKMPPELFVDLWKTISSGKDWHGEMCNIAKDKTKYWVQAHMSPIFNEQKIIVGYMAIREDITDKKRVEEIAVKDQLTNLYNRRYLEERVQKEAELFERYATPFSIIIMDLDKFKSVNDIFGHQVGDYVLKALSALLVEHARATDVVGRWGGEEFLIILPQTTRENALKAAEHLRKSIEEFYFDGVGHKSASFGVAEFEGDIDEMIKRADDALYEAKEGGRNRVCG